MIDIFENEADVTWGCVSVEGIPLIVIQTTGPLTSSGLLQLELKDLRLSVMGEFTEEGLNPSTFVVYEYGRLHQPLLACDLSPRLLSLCEASDKGEPWMLALQVLSAEGEKLSKTYSVVGRSTRLLRGPEGCEVLPRWFVYLLEDAPDV